MHQLIFHCDSSLAVILLIAALLNEPPPYTPAIGEVRIAGGRC